MMDSGFAGSRWIERLLADAVVLSHLRALTAKSNPDVTVMDGNVRETAAMLDAIAAAIDLSAPPCLMMGLDGDAAGVTA